MRSNSNIPKVRKIFNNILLAASAYPREEWGIRTPILLEHGPQDFSTTFVKFFKSVSPHLWEIEGVVQHIFQDCALRPPLLESLMCLWLIKMAPDYATRFLIYFYYIQSNCEGTNLWYTCYSLSAEIISTFTLSDFKSTIWREWFAITAAS